MKRWGCVLIACLATVTTVAQQPLLDSVVNPGSLKAIVQFLATDSLKGRFTGSPGQEQAASYIAGEFQKAGLIPMTGYTDYFIPFTFTWNGESYTGKNIVGVLPGKKKEKELLLFSAHYDHIGTVSTNPAKMLPERGNPEKGDTVYNGANDNASGISAVISMARYFGIVKNNERTLVFIAFAGEELGLIGSRELARVMDIESVTAVINMDMLGIPSGKRNKNPFITGSPLSDLSFLLNKELYNANPSLYGREYFKRDPYLTEHLFTRSDNLWFAMRGVAAHTIITTPPNNRYYHSLNDEPGTLDYNGLAGIIKAIILGATGIIEGVQTPGKLDIEHINNY